MTDGSTQYLVRWQDLTYAECTWEDEDFDVPDLAQFIKEYEDLRYVCGADVAVSIAVRRIVAISIESSLKLLIEL